MRQFRNDYSEGAAPAILAALAATNLEQTVGYTEGDPYCAQARELIAAACGFAGVEAPGEAAGAAEKCGEVAAADESAAEKRRALVEFCPGGTSANTICLAAMTEDYEAIIATPDAHIATHETGSVGACGRTILLTSDTNGFMSVEAAERVYQQFTSGGRHMVKPAVVYLTNATELGGVYTRAQLEELCAWAHERGLRVYLDGARLGSALTSPANDLTLPQLAALVDVFTIGGTKNGMLFGEAVVSRDARLNRTFGYVQKQRGGLMAKGRLYGVQYVAAFENGLYWELAKAANAAAQKLAEGLCALGWEPYGNSPSNQRFFVVDPALAKEAAARWGCEVYSTLPSGKQVIRFVCSWATTLEDIDELLASARALL